MGLPPPVLVAQIIPPMPVTRQLVRHVRTPGLIVQRVRCVVEHPLPREHITLLLRTLSPAPLTGHSGQLDFPATVLSSGIAFSESIDNLYKKKKKTPSFELITSRIKRKPEIRRKIQEEEEEEDLGVGREV